MNVKPIVEKPLIPKEPVEGKPVEGKPKPKRRILGDEEDDFVVDDVNGINGYEEDNDADTKAEFTMVDWAEQIDGESYPEEDADEDSTEESDKEKNGNSGTLNNFFMIACCALLAFILI